jgi:hypothetical protein
VVVAELLGLALKQPVKDIAWIEQWILLNHVRAELRDKLGQAVFEAGWKRGQSLAFALRYLQGC